MAADEPGAVAQRKGAVIAACRKGPWGSEVSGLEVRDGTADELAPGPDTFSVLPTL